MNKKTGQENGGKWVDDRRLKQWNRYISHSINEFTINFLEEYYTEGKPFDWIHGKYRDNGFRLKCL